MTATDELRRLLDERGVEWRDEGYPTTNTAWAADGVMWRGLFRDGCIELVAQLTPEQAVEATLGRGTCENLITRVKGQMPMLHCEECGCTTTLNVPSGGAGYAGETEMRWPRFCSNCGRKVVDA